MQRRMYEKKKILTSLNFFANNFNQPVLKWGFDVHAAEF